MTQQKMMLIRFTQEYRGRIDPKRKFFPVGIHEVTEKVGKIFLSKHPEYCSEFVENPSFLSPVVEKVEEIKDLPEKVGKFPVECCSKIFKNQGSLNLHRKAKSCPNNPKKKSE